MSNVIKAENLGKKYIIGHQKQRYGATLRDTMAHTARGIWQRMRHPLSPNRESIDLEELWALKDVNFEVQQGERLGIIGPNGAGKSTLLKILSRITEPTTGRVRIKGRVSSLLEVGTGFHPELTGRENVFLNGAILGMTKQEIKKKFDEIVAFAELEKFLDTPVKRYSSGMFVRLAFAVAAHLEPEILIVDEVLAVGDASFQKKCLGKMQNVAKQGRTILFVSHNMAAITRLCQRVCCLDTGQLCIDGPTEQVVSHYLTSSAALDGQCIWDKGIANRGVDELIIRAVCLKTGNDEVAGRLDSRIPFCVEIEYEILKSLPFCRVGILLTTVDGIPVFEAYDTDKEEYAGPRKSGTFISRCKIPANLLNPGRFIISVNAGIPNNKNLAFIEGALTFDIEDIGAVGSHMHSKRKGIIRPRLEWNCERA